MNAYPVPKFELGARVWHLYRASRSDICTACGQSRRIGHTYYVLYGEVEKVQFVLNGDQVVVEYVLRGVASTALEPDMFSTCKAAEEEKARREEGEGK